MRIIGGANRGRRLAAPRGLATRPTAERVREALFDIVGPAVRGMRVLDLFAGTGAVGIEALSRGALRAVFVEQRRDALRALRANLAALGVSRERGRIVAGNVLRVLSGPAASEAPFDLIFLDPPYASHVGPSVLDALARGPFLAPDARVVVQHRSGAQALAVAGLIPAGPSRRFGETALTFLRRERYTPSGSRQTVPHPSTDQP